MKKPFLFLCLFVGAAVLFSWIYLPALSRYQDLKTRQEGIDIQSKNLQTKVKDIREERDLLKNDVGYLEKVIREELGLVKPGEIVYKFVAEKPVPKPPALVEPSAAEGTPKTEIVTPAAPLAAAPVPVQSPALVVPAKLVSNEPALPSPVPTIAPKPVVPAVEVVYPRRETR